MYQELSCKLMNKWDKIGPLDCSQCAWREVTEVNKGQNNKYDAGDNI